MRKKSGDVLERWVNIKYDYVPKHCKTCKLQGHNEEECFILHPELYRKEEIEVDGDKEKHNTSKDIRKNRDTTEQKENRDTAIEFKEQGRRTAHKRGRFLSKDKPEQIWNPRRKENNEPQQVTTTNKFEALGDEREIDETKTMSQVHSKG